jgi:membrane-bound metal-dependent hydrolase YbcI (DUF457 family)
VNLDKEGHIVVTMYLMLALAATSVLSPYFLGKELVVFYVGLIIFSSALNPDIDLAIPFIGHRGITHNHYGVIALSVIIALVAYAIKAYLGLALSVNLVLSFIIGAAIAWLLHIVTDAVYDRVKELTWVLIALPLLWILFM